MKPNVSRPLQYGLPLGDKRKVPPAIVSLDRHHVRQLFESPEKPFAKKSIFDLPENLSPFALDMVSLIKDDFMKSQKIQLDEVPFEIALSLMAEIQEAFEQRGFAVDFDEKSKRVKIGIAPHDRDGEYR